jgi:glycosyltransferase involved in cell wall biosynthesis
MDYEIVVVNDCSTDNTQEIAKKNRATVIDHIQNTGAGGATATGISYARQNGFDIAVAMDADGQHDIKDALTGIALLKETGADLLIGNRLDNTDGMSKTKIIGNKGLSFITRILFGVKVADSQSGLRIFSRKSIDNLQWESTGFDFCSEMLWRAKQGKMKVEEFPIRVIYTSYSKAKGQNNWNGINLVKSMVTQRLREIIE